MKSDIPYLDYILDAIAAVEEYTHGGREAFMSSRLVRDAVLRNLQTIAESTKRLSPERKATHPEVPWRRIAAFRNTLVHEYERLDLDSIWDVVIVQSLPALRDAVAQMRVAGSMPPSPRSRDDADA